MVKIPNIYSDHHQLKIKVIECNEHLVDVRKYCNDITLRIYPEMKENTFYLRKRVIEMLNKADSLLPKGYKILLLDAYRPLEIQEKFFKDFCIELKNKHPNFNDAKIRKEASKFVAPPDVKILPPHSTGGAVDITIIDKYGNEIDMGTKPDDLNFKAYTYCREISRAAKHNRKILIRVMRRAGFVNYPREWWHWSYGDKCWAAVKKINSIYGIVDFNNHLIEKH